MEKGGILSGDALNYKTISPAETSLIPYIAAAKWPIMRA
jgi:hypothetical protein